MPEVEKLLRKYIDLPSDDGKRHRVTVSATTQKELEQKYREKLMELAKTDFRFARTATVANFFGRYMQYYVRPTLREGARHDKEARLRRYLVEPLGGYELSSVTTPMLQKLLNDQKGKSKSFLLKLKGELTAFFEAAEDEALVPRNPCKRLFIPDAEAGERRALTEEERRVFLIAADQQKHGLIFQFIYYCGLRPGEVRALTYADIDYDAKTVTVNKALEDRTGEIKSPKTKSGYRTVPIPDELFKKLPKKGTGYIFKGDRSGKLLASSNYKRAWRSLLNRMDIEMGAKTYRNKILPDTSILDRSITPYYLRHTYCSMLAENGVDIKTAQYFMGHSNISVTANIYQHVTEKMFTIGAERVKNL